MQCESANKRPVWTLDCEVRLVSADADGSTASPPRPGELPDPCGPLALSFSLSDTCAGASQHVRVCIAMVVCICNKFKRSAKLYQPNTLYNRTDLHLVNFIPGNKKNNAALQYPP